jgi:Lrp/AsnC family transcriptional regulator
MGLGTEQVRQLSDLDRRILRALQQDASLSIAALAEQVSSSAASCWRRIQALEKSGVLGPPVRLVDPQAVGRDVNVMLQLRMKSHAPEARKAIESLLRSRPEVVECHSMSGEWDYLLRVVVSDVADYDRFLSSILTHGNIANSASHFALAQIKYTTALPV